MRNSSRESFNNCPRKYKHEQDGLQKIVESSDKNHADWGSAIHLGLKTHYDGGSLEDAKKAFLSLYPENLDETNMAKNKDSGLAVIERYIQHYGSIDSVWEILATEEEGSVEFSGETHDLHVDLIARHRQSCEIYLWDHKTTEKNVNPSYWMGFELSAQLTRYTVYVKEKYGQCSGAIINNIAVKHLKIKNKYGEGPGFVCSFDRQMFNRTPQQIAFWKESEEDWLKLIRFCETENAWPKALGKLCSYCSYYELCMASGDDQIKELMYEIKKEVKA